MESKKKQRIKHAKELGNLGGTAPNIQEIPRRHSSRKDKPPSCYSVELERVSAGGAAANGGGGDSPRKGSKGRP